MLLPPWPGDMYLPAYSSIGGRDAGDRPKIRIEVKYAVDKRKQIVRDLGFAAFGR